MTALQRLHRHTTLWLASRGQWLAWLLVYLAVISLSSKPLVAKEPGNSVPMHDRGQSTYYLPCQVEGYGDVEMLFDTGSAYTTINEHTLNVLKEKGLATYVKELEAKMADGSYRVIPVYRLASITVGDACEIEDVEAAVLPGRTRAMLGLSALNKASPITFSTDPPSLMLGGCAQKSK